MEITCVNNGLLSLCENGFWMSTLIRYEHTCAEREQWAVMEIMSLQHPLERMILDQRMMAGASCSQIMPTITRHFAWLVCIWPLISQQHSMVRAHTHTHTGTESCHGNWTLRVICARFDLHVSVCFVVFFLVYLESQQQHLASEDLWW